MAIKDVKSLEIRRDQLKEKLVNIDKQISDLVRDKKETENKIASLNKTIEIALEEIKVTDHAIVRYFERILNYDVDRIREVILPEEIKESIKTLRNCEYPRNGFKIVVQNNKVITVVK